VTTGTYVEVIEAVQRDALDSMGTLFATDGLSSNGPDEGHHEIDFCRQRCRQNCRQLAWEMRIILRHSSITVTTGTYVEVIEAVQRDALDSMGTLFATDELSSKLSSNDPAEGHQEEELPGGAKGIRTPDPHTASVVRYQLRHSPKTCPSKLHH
jgi:hypothetical protein